MWVVTMFRASRWNSGPGYERIIPAACRFQNGASDREGAIQVAFTELVGGQDGQELYPARGSGKSTFLGFSGRIDPRTRNVSGSYYLVQADSSKQAYAYLCRFLGHRPDWVEQIRCRRVKAEIGIGA